ncbi:hypothetical protein GPECTOR_16g591 [Gonium pectorale]|uniref:ABC transporter family G domain-containing protein n=1 Tax=Gonium pectorale TaxID=33097 RepID=A0A150GKV2_GONPE|nr:hypothetical protein GPECTOR_16g591 [Gonium pectorale]|eukprot:KXZ50417.1 hypothetical protein GPECTOR_16g591 [Gonium pectorale]
MGITDLHVELDFINFKPKRRSAPMLRISEGGGGGALRQLLNSDDKAMFQDVYRFYRERSRIKAGNIQLISASVRRRAAEVRQIDGDGRGSGASGAAPADRGEALAATSVNSAGSGGEGGGLLSGAAGSGESVPRASPGARLARKKSSTLQLMQLAIRNDMAAQAAMAAANAAAAAFGEGAFIGPTPMRPLLDMGDFLGHDVGGGALSGGVAGRRTAPPLRDAVMRRSSGPQGYLPPPYLYRQGSGVLSGVGSSGRLGEVYNQDYDSPRHVRFQRQRSGRRSVELPFGAPPNDVAGGTAGSRFAQPRRGVSSFLSRGSGGAHLEEIRQQFGSPPLHTRHGSGSAVSATASAALVRARLLEGQQQQGRAATVNVAASALSGLSNVVADVGPASPRGPVGLSPLASAGSGQRLSGGQLRGRLVLRQQRASQLSLISPDEAVHEEGALRGTATAAAATSSMHTLTAGPRATLAGPTEEKEKEEEEEEEELPDGYWFALKWRGSQLLWLVIRKLHNSTRQFWVTVLDVTLLLGAAFIVGNVQGSDWDLGSVPANVTMAYLVQAVLNSVVHLRVFTAARNVQRHECELGVSAVSAYTACVLTDLGWIALSPAIYYAVYHFVVVPRASFSEYYTVGLLVCWWSSGLAYTVSLSMIPPQAQLIFTIVLILIIGAFLHGLSPSIASARGGPMEAVLGFSYSRWAMEAATIKEYKHYMSYRKVEIAATFYDVGICRMDTRMADDGDASVSASEAISFLRLQQTLDESTCDTDYTRACLILFCSGIAWRLVAFVQIIVENHWQRYQLNVERTWRWVNECCSCWNDGRASIIERIVEATQNAVGEAGDVLRGWVAKLHRQKNSRGTYVEWACENGRTDILQELLLAGTKLSDTPESAYRPLQLAIFRGHASIVEVLLSRGYDGMLEDTSSPDGMAPLHRACQYGKKSIVQLLLRAEANPKQKCSKSPVSGVTKP